MIFTSNIGSRSLSCAGLCAALILVYGGIVASLEVPPTAKASDTTNESVSNQAFSVSSEVDSSYIRTTKTSYVTLASADQREDHLSLMQMNSELSDAADDNKTPKEIHKDAQKRAEYTEGETPVMTATDKEEILWLARIVYSETKRPHEQRLVAWVVRNRVDTGYTGQTYEAVANHSSQFSGLQPSDPRYEHNMSRWWASQGHSWNNALRIAKEVYFAPESERPFSVTTRHFYSPVAVSKPDWARGREAVRVINSSHARAPRFAFYARVR
jgi:spore germination cell wall hydrolase CwlJ-like protein